MILQGRELPRPHQLPYAEPATLGEGRKGAAEEMLNNFCASCMAVFFPSFVKTCPKFSYNQSRFKLSELCLGKGTVLLLLKPWK